MSYRVGVFVGSAASDSINKKLAKALVKLAPPELKLVDIPIGKLPLYSRDYDADFPAEARAFKASVDAVDAIIFVTPECYIHFTEGLIDDDGNVTVPSTEEFLRRWLQEFHIFVVKVVSAQKITVWASGRACPAQAPKGAPGANASAAKRSPMT